MQLANRRTPVGKVRPSESARRKAASGQTGDGLPGYGDSLLSVITTPTPV